MTIHRNANFMSLVVNIMDADFTVTHYNNYYIHVGIRIMDKGTYGHVPSVDTTAVYIEGCSGVPLK